MLPITLQRLQAQYPDRIHAIDDERCDDNGYWLMLTPAWFSPEMECRTLHEMTVRDLVRQFNACRPAQPGE